MGKATEKKLIAEFETILPKLDEEGLAFLLRQAKVHLHNMEVDRLEQEETSIARVKKRGGSKVPGHGTKNGSATDFRVERADDGETYHLVSGGTWKMFTAAEMAAMVAIARGENPEAERARRLHAWLERERRDALSDFSLGANSGPVTLTLLRTLEKAFPGKRTRKRT